MRPFFMHLFGPADRRHRAAAAANSIYIKFHFDSKLNQIARSFDLSSNRTTDDHIFMGLKNTIHNFSFTKSKCTSLKKSNTHTQNKNRTNHQINYVDVEEHTGTVGTQFSPCYCNSIGAKRFILCN